MSLRFSLEVAGSLLRQGDVPSAALSLRYDIRKFLTVGIPWRIAWALPRRVVYFALIRAWGGATRNDPDPLAITASEVVERWEDGAGK